MDDVFFQLPSSQMMDGLDSKMLKESEDTDLDNSIDLCNEDTFGSGAIEDDWEFEHNKLVEREDTKSKPGIDIPKPTFQQKDLLPYLHDPVFSPSQLNEEELELSNQQLAAAVEELVLNSDQDQDAIDPAIVSLRKQAPHTLGVLSPSPNLPPYYDTTRHNKLSNLSALFGKSQPIPFNRGGDAEHIWNNKQPSEFQNYPNHVMPSGDASRLQHRSSPPLQDAAILTAIKDNPIKKDLHKMLNLSSPLVLKAEDLERELQESSSPRCPSPVYGISIPRQSEKFSSEDRSLPARSVSPVIGSPSPKAMPIGTPPKHVIMNMMHQLEQQQKLQEKQQHHNLQNTMFHLPGSSGTIAHPPFNPIPGLSQPRIPVMFNRPPSSNGSRMPMPPGAGGLTWPPQHPGLPINPLIAQDVISRLGLRMQSPVHSPVGSPRNFAPLPPHILANQSMRQKLPHPGVMHHMLRPPPRFPNNGPRMSRGPHSQFGPGHLHPEHSKFVRLRQEQRGNQHNRRNYNNQWGYDRDDVIGVPGDPYANIMNQREKDWVVRIQMMALQSHRPEIDDYYYQNYIDRRLRDGKLDANDPNKAPQRLITPSKPNIENRKYVPVQFVNSLGKLTTSSVYNPRQIIDIVHPHKDEEENTVGESSGETRQNLSKRLVVYKAIEKAYDLIAEMEELQVTLSTFDDVNSTERDLVFDDLVIKTKLLTEVLGFHDNVKGELAKDPIFQVMKIRKGKKLISRIMPFLSQADSMLIVHSVFTHLPILIKRDVKDGVLNELYIPISLVISRMNVEQLIGVLPLLSVYVLTAAVKDQVGVSVICKLLDRGRNLSLDEEDRGHWRKFVANISDVIVAVANPKEGSRHVRPSVPSPLLEEFPITVFEILSQHSEQENLETLKSSVERLVSDKLSPTAEEAAT